MLLTALNMLLNQAKLTWVIKDEVLQVTTRRAESCLPTRTYPVAKLLKGDLPGTGLPQDRLIELITTKIDPSSWEHAGGFGRIEFYSLSPGLVVRHTDDVHEQIEVLLATLRRDQEHAALLERKNSLQETHFQEMREKGMKTMYRATEKARAGQVDAAIEILQGFNDEILNDQVLDPRTEIALLCRPVEARIKSFELTRANADSEKDALVRGTRVQMSYLQRACQQAVEQGRFDKAAELASATLALDESAHCLSFFRRVYLRQLEKQFVLFGAGVE
jgi:hypothetical protein